MANKTSQHILSTAATLLGFCLVVITSMDITSYADTSIVDEFTSGIAMALILTCILSFSSIRSNVDHRERLLEKYANYLFVIALVGILVIITLILFHVIK